MSFCPEKLIYCALAPALVLPLPFHRYASWNDFGPVSAWEPSNLVIGSVQCLDLGYVFCIHHIKISAYLNCAWLSLEATIFRSISLLSFASYLACLITTQSLIYKSCLLQGREAGPGSSLMSMWMGPLSAGEFGFNWRGVYLSLLAQCK